MPKVSSYLHGTPSWLDLATPDTAAAQDFYGSLFGWSYDAQPTGGGSDYIMCNKGGSAAAGMMELSPEMAASGMPPVWSSYISVDDLDATVAKVEAAGGQIMRPAMDVMDAGRMAVLADSTGAVFCLWQAKDHIGSEVINEHGAFTWSELMSPDPAAAAGFYANVIGWTKDTMPMPTGDYTVFYTEGGNEDGIAGAMQPPMEGMPSFWGVYFHVDDCEASVAEAKKLGASVLAEPMSVPGVGRFSALMDPQGAAFSVMQPEG